MGCLKLTYNPNSFWEKTAQGKTETDKKVVQMFISVDPMADKYPSMSPYMYCAGNPMKYIDPSGMIWEDPAQARQLKINVETKRDELNRNLADKLSILSQNNLTQEQRDGINNTIAGINARISELSTSINDIAQLGDDQNNIYVLNNNNSFYGNVTRTEDGKVSINAGTTGLTLHEIKHVSQSLNAGGLNFNSSDNRLQVYAPGVEAQINAEIQAYKAQSSFTGAFDGRPFWSKDITPQMIGNLRRADGSLIYPAIQNHFSH